MTRLLRIPLIIALGVLFTSCSQLRPHIAVQNRYTREMFNHAVENDSTEPDFILITVVDVHSGQRRVICTTAPNLLSAVCIRENLAYDDAALRRAREIVL